MKNKITLAFMVLAATTIHAQNITLPEASQKALVMQRIGLTDITISYHSPLAKQRPVWGALVPYNEVWRAGANENTTIAFSSDVIVEGKPVQAGTYGLHILPTEKEWTLILSKNSTSWGSFFYDKSEDALRVTITPKPVNYQDWLSYSFTNLKPNAATVALTWEKLSAEFTVSVDVNNVVLQNIRTELRGVQGFSWQALQQAAAFCQRNNLALDDGMKWVDQSINIQRTFANLRTKSQLLVKKGNTAEADKLMKESMALADEAQLNAYGYDLINQQKMSEALEIFKTNVSRYPQSWNVYDSLGETYLAMGDKKAALSNYKTALAKSPKEQQTRINGIIKTIETK
jgi:tetratricopeptide (TPR) repeat protein